MIIFTYMYIYMYVYVWHILSIIILKGILLFCQPCFESTMCCPRSVDAALKNVQMATGMPQKSSMKTTLRKGNGSFHLFEHVQIPLPILCILPHFCVCFQKGEGQERAELVPKGGVSGRCEDFKIIKTCSNQQSLQLSSSCLPMLSTKACFGSVLGFRN